MNKEETVKLLMLVKSIFPNSFKDLDEMSKNMLVSSWTTFFEDIPLEVMVKVTQLHALKDDFPPTVKKFREEALKIMNPNTPLSPEMAWERGRKTVISFGRYQKDKGMERLRSENEAIARAISAVGWDRICNASDDDIGFIKRDFITYYSETNATEKQNYLVPQGIINRLNQIKLEQSGQANEPKQLPEV